MASLQELMAQHGFESNDDYGYHVRCLRSNPSNTVRCLNIEGDSDRRKTAFASALAGALQYPHALYHDFTQQHEPTPQVTLPDREDENGQKEIPITALDRIITEACAFSEGEHTVMIIDQLQAADFREHIRLYTLIKDGQWLYGDVTFTANKHNLLIFLISEKPLYHSLQKVSFRVWVNAASSRHVDYKPSDFGLDDDALDVMHALANVFNALGVVPTLSEYAKIMVDVQINIHTAEDLCHSIYGWTEGIDRDLLFSEPLSALYEETVTAITHYIGCDSVEVVGIPASA